MFTVNEANTRTTTAVPPGWSTPSPNRAGSAGRTATADVTARARLPGFTLIELMVALAIVALLLLLGMPSFTTFLRNSEIRSTSESLVNGLRAASAEAANRNQPGHLRARQRDRRRLEFWVLDDDGVTQRRSRATRRRKPDRTPRSRSRPPGQLTVTFNGLGRVVQSAESRRPHPPDRHRFHRRRRSASAADHRRRSRIRRSRASRADSACATPIRRSPRSCLPIRGPADMKLPRSLRSPHAAPHAADRQLPARGADRDPHLLVRHPRADRPSRQLAAHHQRRPLSVRGGEPGERDDRRHVDDDRRADGHGIRRRRREAHGVAGQGERACCRRRRPIRPRSTSRSRACRRKAGPSSSPSSGRCPAKRSSIST